MIAAAKFIFVAWLVVSAQGSALSQTSAPAEWERVLAAAKKEGKLAAGIPASADLRKQMEAAFKAHRDLLQATESSGRRH